MRPWAEALADPARLRAAIDRLALRRRGRGELPQAMIFARDPFARLLAADVRARVHVPAPARVRRVMLDKERELFAFAPADQVLHDAFAALLTERMEPHLSPRLYSYRRGRSALSAIADFVAYVRAHRRAVPEVRRRGLWVVRCDVRAYGESIALGDDAPLWDDLRAVLGDADPAAWALAAAMVRPQVEGGEARSLGVPTGSPVATALTNLYLVPLDRALEALPGAFTARYGDDLLVAHPDESVARAGLAAIERILAARGLELNPAKRKILWFTGCGARPAAADAEGAQGVVYLGMEVGFAGTVSLPRRKERELLGALRERIGRTARLCAGLAPEERGRAVGAALAQALDPRSPFAAAHADLVSSAVTDRRRLGELDALLALAVAEQVTRARGVRTFRIAPPRRQRRVWSVPSLVAARNRR